ncbi:cysteine protease StiP family protein [Halobacillus salinarum]|uniref:Cysteine protease StiP family protein n=1 Tax=Halobacillus salinarum TaxID=2932257 RepID=A0ABY4EK98_9BACI|nr:cysteine protease StiP family protein [Halobacillus salinarum]UOQ43952.1 cysteine protease StiP family protein [Halobacillus salinarum]
MTIVEIKHTVKGSYSSQDVIFLLKDLSEVRMERSTEERERAIQQGVHYSEMLPVEYEPTDEYLQLFYRSLKENKQRVALAAGVVAEQILEKKGRQTVLCSLARAGTPIGVLIKRYILFKYNVDLPHYSISIIRDRGIDRNALHYIERNHPGLSLMFIDGWTGKGAITQELIKALTSYNRLFKTEHSSELAVLADPGYCSSLYGTREDFIIPSACLNSTISGLVSRSVLNTQWINPDEFHGAKYYEELKAKDLSNYYVDTISQEFPEIKPLVEARLTEIKQNFTPPSWEGLASIKRIQEQFDIEDINLVKPGVGETTRVLLRRIPWKILINPSSEQDLAHILMLAEDRNVTVEEFSDMAYACCGIIKPLEKKR